ncbi:MAG: hypothetical protein AAGM16_08670 [Pseudomonadota bacterium]
MTEHDDPEFDDVREAYRRDGGELPDAALDQRILAAAQRATEPAAEAPRWRPGLAVAAVVVLSATLVLTMRPPESNESATSAPASAQTQATAEASPAESARTADDNLVAADVAEESEVVDTIVVTGSRVSQDASIDAEHRPVAAKSEPARRERALERVPQSMVASPAVAPDLPERREQVAATELDAEGAEEVARQAAASTEPELLGIAAAVDAAAPTDVRVQLIIDTWERGDADAALKALDDLVANDEALTATELKAQLPEALFLTWRERE